MSVSLCHANKRPIFRAVLLMKLFAALPAARPTAEMPLPTAAKPLPIGANALFSASSEHGRIAKETISAAGSFQQRCQARPKMLLRTSILQYLFDAEDVLKPLKVPALRRVRTTTSFFASRKPSYCMNLPNNSPRRNQKSTRTRFVCPL